MINTTKRNEIGIDDILSAFSVSEVPEANLQLADPSLVAYYKSYSNRIIYLDRDIDDTLFGEIRKIIQWNLEDTKNGIPIEDRKPIKIYIHSYGGSLDATFAMIDVMNLSKTPIYTYNLNCALSAGCVIFINGHKGHRYAMPTSKALVHEGSGGTSGTFGETQAQMADYKKMVDNMKENIMSHTTIDQKTMTKWKNKDVYLYPEDQIKYGICDEILDDITKMF